MGDFGQQLRPSSKTNPPKPMAIIGMACRLPAESTNVENLWTALASGESGWSHHPPNRLLPDIYYHPNPDKKGCYDTKGAHYVREDLGRFDAAFFNVKAAEATTMDPQQRHLLEVAYEALENAGLPMSLVAGTQTGVFVGGNVSDYKIHVQRDKHNLPMYETTGNAESLLANRISYCFDLRGPSMSIDTACSSSLVALDTAFQALQTGDLSAAIVGGSHLIIEPGDTVSLSTTRLLSPDGKSYAFDERATSGFGRGEGTSCIIIKPLDAALRDGDPVRAIIRNTGCNQDGKTAGITMPNGEAQKSLMRSVYGAVGLDPMETTYIEAHGTGTATGDPIEAAALGAIFGRPSDQRPIIIGSIKSNIGHLEASSGISSVIKTALMLERRFLVPDCDLQQLNSRIPFHVWNMKVSHKYKPWDSDAIRRASVNNFGFGGTNAHIVMEEAIDRPDGVFSKAISTLGTMSNPSSTELITSRLAHFVFLFSANDQQSLQRQISLISSYVKERPISLYPRLLKSLAYTLGQRRSSHSWRIAVPASSHDELVQGPHDALTPIKATERPTIGFLFTGQGAQWPTMGMGLYQRYTTYAKSLDEASQILSKLGASWSLIEEIKKNKSSSMINKPHISQPACTALQMALVDLLSSWGIKPNCVSGHSSGEIAAAYAAGILDFESCVAIAYYRGVVSTMLAENPSKSAGAMLAVGASQKEAQDLIDTISDAGVRVACVNSPSSTTISGDADGISLIQRLADEKSIWNKRLHVDVAYHSHHMDLISGQYRDFLGELQPNAQVAVEFFSSLKGHKVDPASLSAAYWVENLKSPVLFSHAVRNLCETTGPDGKRGVDVLIEVGPHSALQGPVRQILQTLPGKESTMRSLPSLTRNKDDPTSLLDLVSTLWMIGCQLNIGPINFPDSPSALPGVLTDLPPYQWNHSKRYWHDGRINVEKQSHSVPRHDLLGSRVDDGNSLEPQWTNMLVLDNVPWLRDHKVDDLIVFPAAGYICMALEACRQQAKWKDIKYDRIVFRDISILQALTISDSASVELRLSLVPSSESAKTMSDTWSKFRVFSWANERGWAEHCRGLVAAALPPRQNDVEGSSRDKSSLQEGLQRLQKQMGLCTEPADPGKLWDQSAKSGFDVGPIFRGVSQLMMGSSESTYVATIPDTAACMPYNHESEYVLHPIGLDSLFQAPVFFLTKPGGEHVDPYMPVAMQEMTILTNATWKAGSQMNVFALSSGGDTFSRSRLYDYAGVDAQGICGLLIKGLVETPIRFSQSLHDENRTQCLRMQWEPCVSLLTPRQFEEVLASSSPEPSEVDEFKMLEDLSYHYTKQALQETDPKFVGAPHLVRLLDWMGRQAQVEGDKDGILVHASDRDPHDLLESAKTLNSTMSLICDVGEKLPAILRGEIDPDSLTTPIDWWTFGGLGGYERLFTLAANCFEMLRRQKPRLRVLVHGGGTAAAAGAWILQSSERVSGCSGQPAQFDFTNQDSDFLEVVRTKLTPIAHLINHKVLDVKESPEAQGLELGSYDLVITCDLYDSTSKPCDLANIRSLLKVRGQLMSLETHNLRNRLSSFPFAILPVPAANQKEGFHMNGDFHLEGPDSPWEERLHKRLILNHFSGLDGAARDYPKHPKKAASVIYSIAIDQSTSSNKSNSEIVVVSQWLPHGITRSKIEAVLSACEPRNVTWIDFSMLINSDLEGKYCIVIDNPNSSYLTRLTCESFNGLKRLPQTAGVLWITGGLLSPNAGLVKGLARTIRAEFQMKNFVTLAIDKWEGGDVNVVEIIGKLFKRSFCPSSQECEDHIETEVVITDGVVRIPRLIPDVNMDQLLLRETWPKTRYLQQFTQEGRPLKLTIANPGFLDTLCFVDDETAIQELQDDEIEIDIRASGLNFKDVILALGQLGGNHLGQECSGVVTRIGREVTDLQPGDRVCAVTPSAIANLGRCPAHHAVCIPESMSYPEGASLPVIYCTAYYCLVHVANLQRDETILIHAAAGGVGQAAIMLAQTLGAKIFATVGHADKKDFLMKTYGIPEDDIFYSRDTSFAQRVLDATNDAGVNVALSSLAGEQLRATWQCMAPFGRFVEIGKRDIMSNMHLEMAPFERSVSFTAFDLGDLMKCRPEQMRQTFSEVMDLIRRNKIRPVAPIHEFSVSQVEMAFRSLQSGKPMGKVVIVSKGDGAVMATRPTHEPAIFQADASYLITGGTGGIGRALCEWMAKHGATNIILASRSGKSQGDTMEMVQRLSVEDVRVEVCQCDVASAAEVDHLIGECRKSMPPIRGIIHGAYVNKDVLFENAAFSDWDSVVRPKFHGAWNLHSAFLSQPLDFFIMLSSISGVIGNRGQAAYAAANSFLDDFARYRVSQGLTGTSIDLGVVQEIGHVAEREALQAKLSPLSGNSALSKAHVLALVKLAIRGEIDKHADHQCVVGLNFEQCDVRNPAFFWATDERFVHLRRDDDSSDAAATAAQATPKQALLNSPTRADAVRAATDALVDKFSAVLIVPVEELSREKSVVSLGLDSLVAVEVRSWIKREMDAAMNTMELLTSASIVSLADMVVEKSGLCERFRAESQDDV